MAHVDVVGADDLLTSTQIQVVVSYLFEKVGSSFCAYLLLLFSYSHVVKAHLSVLCCLGEN